MTSWSRRLNAANARPGLGGPGAHGGREDIAAEAVAAGVGDDDLAALRALAAVARDRPAFRQRLTVSVPSDGEPTSLEFEVFHAESGVTIRPVGGSFASPPEEQDDEGSPIVQILTDTLVETPDLVAVFASVGHEALWANDAFATVIPIRQADKIWLVELLDEWSKGHYEVKVLPALVKYGRWRGRLTLLAGDEMSMAVSAVIVAHRDKRGDIQAVSLVARELIDTRLEQVSGGDADRFAALVENNADIIAVCRPDGVIEYASPAAGRVLGRSPGELRGVNLYEILDPDDRPASLLELARPDEQGVGVPVELRVAGGDGSLRHLEAIVIDLTENPVIGGVVLNARDVTERVRTISELTRRAYTDPLTGLANRMRLLDRLDWNLGEGGDGQRVAVLLADVDRFESVNERYGQEPADRVLTELATRFAAVLPAEALAARHSGDQFVAVLPDTPDVAAAVRVANRLRLSLSSAVAIDDATRTEVTVSVGIRLAEPGDDPETVLRDAARALTAAKDAGRDRVEVYSEEMATEDNLRHEVEERLRHALDNDGIAVHYQPVFEVTSGKLVGAEALLRVHDDEGSLLSPAQFVEAAESTGLITRLGSQVLEATCGQLASWSSSSGSAPNDVSVNISPRQLADPEMPHMVVDALKSAGVSPEHLWLEITESILISLQPTVDAGISYLRALGVKIGLDDFGAGQSSLGYLKRFPLDFVKIDKSLVAGLGTDEQDTAIVRATIELAHNLGLVVVAVGVETPQQLEILELLGCERAQGYLYSPAVPAEEFPALASR
ncbi:MAG: EAL domain-containing protein [Acidimicrobiia bacterium]|nr:EAL domain-containing protein [Acidimicrobiia bacterium]